MHLAAIYHLLVLWCKNSVDTNGILYHLWNVNTIVCRFWYSLLTSLLDYLKLQDIQLVISPTKYLYREPLSGSEVHPNGVLIQILAAPTDPLIWHSTISLSPSAMEHIINSASDTNYVSCATPLTKPFIQKSSFTVNLMKALPIRAQFGPWSSRIFQRQ